MVCCRSFLFSFFVEKSSSQYYRFWKSRITQYKEFAQTAVKTIGVKYTDRFSPRMDMIIKYANKLATSNFVVLIKCHVRVIIRLWFTFVTLKGTFQCFGNSSVTDITMTRTHMIASKPQIILLPPYPSMTPSAPKWVGILSGRAA